MDKQKEIEELKAFLLEKSSMKIKPVFVDKNGEEHPINNKEALKVFNDILEQAFIPYVAEQVINAGYGNVKRAVMEFTEKLKQSLIDKYQSLNVLAHNSFLALPAILDVVKEVEQELYGED